MKRNSLIFLVLIVLSVHGKAMAQGEDMASSMNVSPPPVRTSHLQQGAMSSNNAAIYVGMDSDIMSLNMYGLASEATMGITDKVAISMMGTGIYGGATSSMSMGSSTMDMEMSMGMGVFGINVLVSLVQSEKRNSIGEITKIGSGLSLFGGGQFSMMGMGSKMSMPEQCYYGTCYGGDVSVTGFLMFYQFQVGAIGELALHPQFQLVPYAYVGSTAGTMSMTMESGGDTQYTDVDIPSSSITSYGADIVIRPMRNNPKFKISLGTLLQQISANEGGMTFIVVGFSYEAGARYSETQFGPVLQ